MGIKDKKLSKKVGKVHKKDKMKKYMQNMQADVQDRITQVDNIIRLNIY